MPICAVSTTEELWEVAKEKGDYIMPKVQGFAEAYPKVYKTVTGKGLLIGQHFQTPEIGGAVAAAMFKRGVLASGTLTNALTIRIEPPLVITYEEIDEGLNRLEDAVKEVAATL
jgi:putrescine aminotransferase